MSESDREITPAEIRSIRKRLGLTQEAAGKLIGGGPRAFSKYESGTVTPNAAVVNLLRLLEVDPTAMSLLEGGEHRRETPLAPSPFEATVEAIKGLTPQALAELLRRLLSAEAQANKIPLDGIHVASVIHTPDGGEDGRIMWDGGPKRTAFLPSRLCQFQLKAAKVFPKDAAKDVVHKRGSVKGMVQRVLEQGGHYIMVCSQPYTHEQIEDRKTRIHGALRDGGLDVADTQIDFRDASQVATWVNRYPAVAIWVKETTKIGRTSPFESWDRWVARAEHQGPPVPDERIQAVRTYLRERLSHARGIARVLGMSGVGKSRLVLDALRSAGSDGATGRRLSDMIMYATLAEVDSTAMLRTVQDLADSGVRAVVVVDDCPPETRLVLIGAVLRKESRLSLLVIDDEASPEETDETTLKIGKASQAVIESIVHQVSPDLPSMDQERLVRFAQGFPKIAIRIAMAWNRTQPLAHATDDTLVDSFILGPRPENHDLLRKAAALLAVFRLVRLELMPDGPLARIASFGRNISAEDLYAAIQWLVDRGVAQLRGQFAILQPLPIALRLAERQWREWPKARWDEVLSGDANPRLNVLAARQLALLNTTEVAHEVVKHVCEGGRHFGGIDGITKVGHGEVLSALAEIDHEEVAYRLEGTLADVPNPFHLPTAVVRHLVSASAKIAFFSSTFEEGAGLLLQLGAVDDDQGYASQAFKALFPVVLGDTEADGEARLMFLDGAASVGNSVRRGLVVDALEAGCKTHRFSRMVGVEIQGTRPTREPWHPATTDEYSRYITGCIARLTEFALLDCELGDKARSALGGSIAALVRAGFLVAVERAVKEVVASGHWWTLALRQLKSVLVHSRANVSDDVSDRIRSLVTLLEPTTLESRVRSLVMEAPLPEAGDEPEKWEHQHQRRLKKLRTLAEELLAQPKKLASLLPQLSRGQQWMAQELGVAIAERVVSPTDWLQPMIRAVVETSKPERNYDILSGYVAGLAPSHPTVVDSFKSLAAESSDLAPSFPLVCAQLGITPSDVQVAIGAIKRHLLSPWRLNSWAHAWKLDQIPDTSLALLIDALLDHSAEGYGQAAELMSRISHDAGDRLDGFAPQVAKLAANSTRWRVSEARRLRDPVMVGYYFEVIVGRMLAKGRGDPAARATALALAQAVASGVDDTWLKPVLPALLSGFAEIAWPLIGQAALSSEQRHRLGYMLGDPISGLRDSNPPLLSLPEDALLAWCHAYPDQAPAFAVQYLPLLTHWKDDGVEIGFHPLMIKLLDEFGYREDVQKAVWTNMHTYGWSGSSATYYTLYEEPFSTLSRHRRPELRRWAKRTLRGLRHAINRETRRDQERDVFYDL